MPYEIHLSSFGTAQLAKATLIKICEWVVGCPSFEVRRIGTRPAFEAEEYFDFFGLPQTFLRQRDLFVWDEPLFDIVPSGSRNQISWKRVVLWGTSHGLRLSASRLSLGALVARALDVPLIDASVAGRGKAGGFKKLQEMNIRLNPQTDLFLWEFSMIDALGTEPFPIESMKAS